jgi:multiple sugar transport system substrate-binding protein
VKVGAALYQTGMTEEVLTWEGISNNRFMASGDGSMTLNPVSALRAIEKQNPQLAGQIAFAPLPAGPAGRLGIHNVMGVYVIWRFAQNQEAAKQFLVDLVLNYREAFARSESYNLPAFPGAVKDLAQLLASDAQAQPPGKYALLAQATEWSTNIGHPGQANAATDEVFNEYLVPKMFAAAARKEMSAEDAVRAAEAQIKPIFERWRQQGKI